jgi:hypothetical protein
MEQNALHAMQDMLSLILGPPFALFVKQENIRAKCKEPLNVLYAWLDQTLWLELHCEQVAVACLGILVLMVVFVRRAHLASTRQLSEIVFAKHAHQEHTRIVLSRWPATGETTAAEAILLWAMATVTVTRIVLKALCVGRIIVARLGVHGRLMTTAA